VELAYPWVEIPDPHIFEGQLKSELPPGHVLSGIQVRARAHLEGTDDILFELLDGSGRVAVVHLSYSTNVDSIWPWTELYESLERWSHERMRRGAGGIDA
jgi:hypothetical protein